MRPSLRQSRDVHGLSRMLGGRGSDDKEAGDTGTPVAGTVWSSYCNSSMADDKTPPEGETSHVLNPDERFFWHVVTVCMFISLEVPM